MQEMCHLIYCHFGFIYDGIAVVHQASVARTCRTIAACCVAVFIFTNFPVRLPGVVLVEMRFQPWIDCC